MNFLKSNFWEIDRSQLLHNFGAILSFLHVINFVFWYGQTYFLNLGSARPLLCWDFFPTCAAASEPFSHGGLVTLFSAYLFFSLLAFVSFVWRRFIRASWCFLFLANVIAFFFYIFDASLSQDIYALFFFLNFGFLFCPNKTSLIRFSVIAFYLLVGYRELQPEWLSGHALHAALPYNYKVLEWLAAVGIAIKWTLPFLLISSVGQRVALGVAGLVSFHIFQFYFFRDFSAIALISFNFYFILEFFTRQQLERESLYQSYAHPEPSKLWWPVLSAVLIFSQTSLAPSTSFFEVLKIDGPTSSVECEHINLVKYDKKIEFLDTTLNRNMPAKIRCNSIVAFNSAKEECRARASDTTFKSISTYFLIKKFNQNEFTEVFSNDNICATDVTYSKTRKEP